MNSYFQMVQQKEMEIDRKRQNEQRGHVLTKILKNKGAKMACKNLASIL